MIVDPTRRGVMLGGCALLTLLGVPGAHAAGRPQTAPRARCPHEHCRHHRPLGDTEGLCALALDGRILEET